MTPSLQERAFGRMNRAGLVGRPRLALLVIWLACALGLAACGIAFLVCGALRGRSGLWFFAGGALCAFASVPTTATLIWYVFCQRPPAKKTMTSGASHQNFSHACSVSTVGGPDTYGAQAKSDYPMGPLLIMTLPKKKDAPGPPSSNHAQRLVKKLTDRLNGGSTDSTPDHIGQRSQKRNVPPLASEETLSPSLKSASHVSIDSAV